MTTATPELKIEPKLPVLAFNFDQLKAWATALAEHYAAIVVTEDAIADVKRDMAELNKAKKAVDEARKEAVRRVSEPIRAFETQIKEVCAIFDSAYAKLGGQVKSFEDAQREEKRKIVEALILEEVDAAYGKEGPRLHIPVQDSWLNKSASLKAVRESIAGIIEKNLEEDRRRKVLEQARQDRTAAIESHVKALNDKHGLNIPVSRFIVGMGSNSERPLADVLADIDQTYADVLEQQRKQREALKNTRPASSWPTPAAEQKTPSVEQTAQKTEQPAPAEEIRAMSIVIQYEVSKEAQVKAGLENLKTLCVNFGARYRQE